MVLELIEVNVFLNDLESYEICVYTKLMTCQNQINMLTGFWLAKKFACDEHNFIRQSEMFFLLFFQRLVFPIAVQKDCGLWERDWH